MIPLAAAFLLGAAAGAGLLVLAFRLTYDRDPDEAALEAARVDTLVYGTAIMARQPDGRLERLDPSAVQIRIVEPREVPRG